MSNEWRLSGKCTLHEWNERRNAEFLVSTLCVEDYVNRMTVSIPRLLCFIGCGLLRHMQEENVPAMTFLDEQDHCFAVFRKVLNARMKLLSKGLMYQSKTSLSDDTWRWGQDLDWWSIRVRLTSSSTVYTFITVWYSVWGLLTNTGI